MSKEEDYTLTGNELQKELLKRMGYQEVGRRCDNCIYFKYPLLSMSEPSHCTLIPVMELNIKDNGYCDYYAKRNE